MDEIPTQLHTPHEQFVLASLAKGKAYLIPTATPKTGSDTPALTEFVFATVDAKVGLVKEAEERFDELVGAHDLRHYEGYAHKTVRLPQDAQACRYNIRIRQARKYQKGRTEVIRSVSNEAKAFVEGILSHPHTHGANSRNVRELFTAAVERHMRHAGWAADAQGVNHHLFGLRKLVKTEEGQKVLALKPFFDGITVVLDGYSLSYSIGDNCIRWTITSLEHRTEVLKHYLAKAATEVREMMDVVRKADLDAEVAKEGKDKLRR
ncbi:hypothetical protein DXG01_005340 [Tephrocybe rancida]|nr:hypothetical protein DXG01_005340 [Tephrocybe rancida]